MTGYAVLLKYVLWALAIGTTIAAIWWGVNIIHNNGRAVEKGICTAKLADIAEQQAKTDAAMAKELGEAIQRVADANEAQLKHLIGVMNEREKAHAVLAERFATDKSGLYIVAKRESPKGCDDPLPLPADSGEGASAEEKTRLPEDVERGLRALAYEAQGVVIDFNALADRCEKGAVIID